jgi:hypothetical protein
MIRAIPDLRKQEPRSRLGDRATGVQPATILLAQSMPMPKSAVCIEPPLPLAVGPSSSAPRPPYPQLQQVLANDELPGEVLLRQDEFLSAGIAGHDMI